MRRDPDVASITRRLAADLIDAGVGVAAVVGLIGALMPTPLNGGRLTRLARRLATDAPDPDSVRRAMWALSALIRLWMVVRRNGRSPGKRLMAIHRVRAGTGGELSVVTAVRAQLAEEMSKRVGTRLFAPARRRHEDRRAEADRRLHGVRAALANDREAQTRATSDILAATRSDCLTPLLKLLGLALLMRLTALWSSRRQTLADRLAGVVVVRS